MCLWAWCCGDQRPALTPIPNLTVVAIRNIALLAEPASLPVHELAARRAQQHQPYGAYAGTTLVAYGWVARRRASVGELNVTFELPTEDRYLWDFRTLPAWRGRGVYPHLLQAITKQESVPGCLWIIHAPENTASGRRITKAGFTPLGRLSFSSSGRPQLAVSSTRARAAQGAAMLGVPLISQARTHTLSSCWRCVLRSEQGCACASGGGCTCAVAA